VLPALRADPVFVTSALPGRIFLLQRIILRNPATSQEIMAGDSLMMPGLGSGVLYVTKSGSFECCCMILPYWSIKDAFSISAYGQMTTFEYMQAG
jgi:hypothetical protein